MCRSLNLDIIRLICAQVPRCEVPQKTAALSLVDRFDFLRIQIIDCFGFICAEDRKRSVNSIVTGFLNTEFPFVITGIKTRIDLMAPVVLRDIVITAISGFPSSEFTHIRVIEGTPQ